MVPFSYIPDNVHDALPFFLLVHTVHAARRITRPPGRFSMLVFRQRGECKCGATRLWKDTDEMFPGRRFRRVCPWFWKKSAFTLFPWRCVVLRVHTVGSLFAAKLCRMFPLRTATCCTRFIDFERQHVKIRAYVINRIRSAVSEVFFSSFLVFVSSAFFPATLAAWFR